MHVNIINKKYINSYKSLIISVSNDTQIGPRLFQFVAASSSQLRDHGVWFYSRDDLGRTAECIRQWMGDFHHINNVATKMARMGQCFSSTQETVEVYSPPLHSPTFDNFFFVLKNVFKTNRCLFKKTVLKTRFVLMIFSFKRIEDKTFCSSVLRTTSIIGPSRGGTPLGRHRTARKRPPAIGSAILLLRRLR